MDELTSVGLVAAPGIISALISMLRPNVLSPVPKAWIPAVALALGLGYSFSAWQFDVFYAPNPFVALVIGLNVALASVGAHEIQERHGV